MIKAMKCKLLCPLNNIRPKTSSIIILNEMEFVVLASEDA
jgi:hypothetical protein